MSVSITPKEGKSAVILKGCSETNGAFSPDIPFRCHGPTAQNTKWTEEARTNLTNRHKSIEWFSKIVKTMDAQWTHFHTHTFRSAIPRHHAMTAGRKFTRWCSEWQSTAPGRRPWPLFRLLLWSAEEHKSGFVHIHALSALSPGQYLRRSNRPNRNHDWSDLGISPLWRILKEDWYGKFGIARIFPYDPQFKFGAERYVTKYVLDENCLDWGLEQW